MTITTVPRKDVYSARRSRLVKTVEQVAEDLGPGQSAELSYRTARERKLLRNALYRYNARTGRELRTRTRGDKLIIYNTPINSES